MNKKQGISLIVLVITIIVMIILAAAVVISLNNNGIINKANTATANTNEKTITQDITLAWLHCKAEKTFTEENLNSQLSSGKVKEGSLEYVEGGNSKLTFITKDNEEQFYVIDKNGNLIKTFYVAEINGEKYDTLQAAINAVPTDGINVEIKLGDNIDEAVTVAAGQNISLNLNGFTLSGAESDKTIITAGTLYVDGGTILTTGNAIYATGPVVIGSKQACNIIGTGSASVVYGENTTVDFYAGKISNGTNGGACVKSYNGNLFTMHGGELICGSDYGVHINGGAKAVVNAGTIISTSTTGNAFYVSGTLVLGNSETGTGPIISCDGYTAINTVRANGEVAIYGGNIEVKNSGNVIKASAGTVKITSGKFVSNNAASIFGANGATITVTGGEFNSGAQYLATQKGGTLNIEAGTYISTNTYLVKKTGGTCNLTGGTFNGNTITDSLIEQ